METLNFVFNLNRVRVDSHLKDMGYSKIGQEKFNPIGYCIMINRKQYFDIEHAGNPTIKTSSNLSDIFHYCV